MIAVLILHLAVNAGGKIKCTSVVAKCFYDYMGCWLLKNACKMLALMDSLSCCGAFYFPFSFDSGESEQRNNKYVRRAIAIGNDQRNNKYGQRAIATCNDYRLLEH
ncbi:hypothetical protein Dsin_032346 [Dipteronia sinensis]|uniref:Secreted protein n=1 Tax=Dipteronia sinensis TaxID=43782 RepID=A0AAE0DU81_9ROSI|nr:hypothetical protein Dsin_032346 [Dipteronia sinensis]